MPPDELRTETAPAAATGVRVLALLTAQEVTVDPTTNAPSIVGVCDLLCCGRVPLTCRLAMFARFVGPPGRTSVGLRVLAPGDELLHEFKREAEFRGRPVNLHHLPALTFPAEGVYRVQALADGAVLAETAVEVKVLAPGREGR